MAATIAVAPARLRGAAADARAVGGRMLEVRGQLGAAVAGLDPALGGAGSRTAFAALWTRWCASIEALAGELATLAGALEAAAAAYERSDRDSLPAATAAAPARRGVDAPAR